MNIIIQSVNFKASFALENFIREKITKLFKQFTTLESANVILREEEKGKLHNKSCEIKLVIPGNDPVVRKSTEVYEKSILQAVETLQKVLRRKKSKFIAKRHSDYRQNNMNATMN